MEVHHQYVYFNEGSCSSLKKNVLATGKSLVSQSPAGSPGDFSVSCPNPPTKKAG